MVNSRAKGARGERMFRDLCREHGWNGVRRTQQYCGNTGDAADVVGLPGIHVEVKNVERLSLTDAMAQSIHDANAEGKGAIPIVASKKNRQAWVISMLAEDWFKLYNVWEADKRISESDVTDHQSC